MKVCALVFCLLLPLASFAADPPARTKTLRAIDQMVDEETVVPLPICVGSLTDARIRVDHSSVLFRLSPRNWTGVRTSDDVGTFENHLLFIRTYERPLDVLLREQTVWDFSTNEEDRMFRSQAYLSHLVTATVQYLVMDAWRGRLLAWRIRESWSGYDRKTGMSTNGYRRGQLDESETRLKPGERVVAEQLVEEGHYVRSAREIPGQRNPEGYLYFPSESGDTLSVPFEVKTLGPDAGVRTIKNRVRSSLKDNGQAPYIFIDARATSLTFEDGPRAIKLIWDYLASGWDVSGKKNRLREIRILGKDFDQTYVFFTLAEVLVRSPTTPPQ